MRVKCIRKDMMYIGTWNIMTINLGTIVNGNNTIYKWKPSTRRPVGRPKSQWEDDVRNGLKKMKLIKWAEQVHDRLKWKDTVEKAKTLPEL
jgi:hypothetical protein